MSSYVRIRTQNKQDNNNHDEDSYEDAIGHPDIHTAFYERILYQCIDKAE